MSQSLEKLIINFLNYIKTERGFAESTVREYQLDLNLFTRFIQQKKNIKSSSLTINCFDRFDVQDFLAYLILERENTAVSRNRRLFALRSFFKYLERQNLIAKDPTILIDPSKTTTKAEPIYLRLQEAKNYLQAIKDSKTKTVVRDLSIIKVFLYCGLRVSELVNLDLVDLDLDDEKVLRVWGKGGKQRLLPLHSELCAQMRIYLNWRNQLINAKKIVVDALFLSLQGKRINVRTVQIMVKKYAQKAALKDAKLITPHKLRHSFASMLYKETKDIRVLGELLGHESIQTTQIYTHTDTDQKRNTLAKMPKL